MEQSGALFMTITALAVGVMRNVQSWLERYRVPSLPDYDVDAVMGFLPSRDPLARLPSGFEPWDALVVELPRLIAEKQVRAAVRSRLGDRRFDVGAILRREDPAVTQRACLVLSMITHGYIWEGGDEDILTHLPAFLAVPLHSINKALGLPPILTYASCVLWNWRRLDVSKPPTIDNLHAIHTMGGGEDESFFFMLTTDMEYRGSRGIALVAQALHAVAASDEPGLTTTLSALDGVLLDLVTVLARMPEGCRPEVRASAMASVCWIECLRRSHSPKHCQ